MFPKLQLTILTAALSITSFFADTITAVPTADTANCIKCSPTIVFEGVVRTLTLTKAEGTTLQCNYDTPSIPGFSPYCFYEDTGALELSNTGGSCPNPAPSC